MEMFGTWLRKQAKRDDRVGDLARDFRTGKSGARSLDGVVSDMKIHRAGPEAWRALGQAFEEWISDDSE